MNIKYVFINSFKWNDTYNQVRFNGLPNENTVCRCLYNDGSKIYSLIVDESKRPYDAIILDQLNIDTEICTAMLTDLNNENILDVINIPEVELDKMIKWMENDNEDLKPKQQLALPPSAQAGFENLLHRAKQQAEEDQLFMQEVYRAFEELNLHNSIYAELLIELAHRLVDYSLSTVDDPGAELELDRDRGMSANLAKALRSLKYYSEPIRHGGEDEDDLDTALLAIMREKERRILNEIR